MTKDDRVLRYIAGFLALHGYPPTVRQVASATEMSVASAHLVIQRLEGTGRLVVERSTNRTLKMEVR